MIKIIAYIINLFSPIVTPFGLFGLLAICGNKDYRMLGVMGFFAFIGLIFGFRAYKLDIPPRWKWSKSSNQVFNFSVSTVLGYAIDFASWPAVIYLIKCLVQTSSE